MLEPDSELRREREKISRRLKQYRKFNRYMGFFLFAGFSLFIFLMFATSETSGLIKGIPSSVAFVPYFMGLLICVIFGRLRKPYELSIEESLFLEVCSTLDDLGVYIEDKREPDMKRAERKVDNISKEIETWNIGSLKLCEKVMGSHFETFKEAFYRKVVGALRQREKDDLVRAFQILREFAKYLVKSEPEIKDLDSMTKAMKEGISVTIPSRIPAQKKIFRFLKEATLFRYILIVTVPLVSGYAIGYIGYYILGVSIEYAYTMAVTVGLTLIATCSHYLRK